MNSASLYPLIAIIGTLLLSPGCSKKVTKVEPIPGDGKPRVEQATKPPIIDNSEQDMENLIREALVPIYFDYNEYTIRSSETPKLERVAALLNNNNRIQLLIEGHCDERGSSDYNMGLGENRGRAVQKWLIAYGIPDVRVKITSFGKERPAVPGCDNDYCHAQNRRDEWKVLAK